MRFKNKVALVTGAGGGIGRAIALAFAKDGADVVVNGAHIESASNTVDEIRSLGGRALAVQADVSKSGEVDQMVDQAINTFEKIDVLVNNAAPSDRAYSDIMDTSEAVLEKHFKVNLKGTFLCSQAVGRHMMELNHGKIINITSPAGSAAIPGIAAYGSSKAAIMQMTRNFAVELGKYNINVNAVCPGTTVTPHHEMLKKEKPDRYLGQLKRLPLKKFAKSEDVACAVLFLASSEADSITGIEITVDNGASVIWGGYAFPEAS